MAKSKILALIFTAFVITLLVLTGPVEGFSLNLAVNKATPRIGEVVTFTAEININQAEMLPVEKLIFELSGNENLVCTFDNAGNPLDSCSNIKITKLSGPENKHGYDYNFGYGYGFSSGTLTYKVEIDTNKMKTGTYHPTLKVKIRDQIFSHSGKTITLRQRASSSGQTCGPEWSCSAWSPCSEGMQYRECQRNLNYCELEKKPEEKRICLLEEGENFREQEVLALNTPAQNIQSTSAPSIQLSNGFSDGIQFIIILLLLNCILTTINIILKVQNDRTLRRKIRQPVQRAK